MMSEATFWVEQAQKHRWCFGVCLFSIAAFFFVPERTEGKSEKGAELVGKLIQRYQQRQNQLTPIWVRFHLNIFESPVFRDKISGGIQREEFRATVEGEYARKGNKTRSWKTSQVAPDDWQREWFTIFTGELSIYPSNQPNTYFITKKPTNNYACSTPFLLAREEHILAVLSHFATDEVVVTSCTNTAHQSGEDLVVLEMLFPKTKWHDKCWVFPGKEWAIYRYESYDASNQLANDCLVEEYDTCRGVYYPKSGVERFYINGKPEKTTDFKVDSIENESSRIPDSLFQFTFPQDSTIWDDDLKVYVRRTELTQSHLDEVVRRAGTNGRNWFAWLFTAGALAGISIIVIGWRITKRKARPRALRTS
jgi:hypothetical protein